MSKLLGIPPQLITKPLTQTLRTNASFQLVEESRPNIAKQLHEQELSAALVSPFEYAKESSDYRIVPNIAVASSVGGIIVRFREGVKTIRSLAVDPTYASEIILTKIILAESFDIEPQIVPMMATQEVMLQKADAALVVGDESFRIQMANVIDVVEEWNEMTGLPFVHALWCGRENSLAKEEIALFQDAQTKGVAGIADLAMQYPLSERDAVRKHLQSFTYALDEQDREGLGEFMKYLFYHGILPDVAELNFYKPENATNDLLSDISPN
jgi:chorismate dehydratase